MPGRSGQEMHISIHALRVEGDQKTPILILADERFLSTPSGWRATKELAETVNVQFAISIHALRVEGDLSQRRNDSNLGNFYPRPPGGGRQSVLALLVTLFLFLSTPSGWRATVKVFKSNCFIPISIHALRVEGDSKNGQSFHLFLRKREKNLPL